LRSTSRDAAGVPARQLLALALDGLLPSLLPQIAPVFTDVHMPGSMDGLRLARVVRNRWPPVSLIVTSGRANVQETDLPTGARFLRKPYEHAQIEAALRQLI
jgi:CheY-like chemotaxis protein